MFRRRVLGLVQTWDRFFLNIEVTGTVEQFLNREENIITFVERSHLLLNATDGLVGVFFIHSGEDDLAELDTLDLS